MKYVKLFESWLALNEAVDVNMLTDLGLRYDDEEAYAKSPEKFGKHIATTLTKLLEKAPKYKATFTSQAKAGSKKITILSTTETETTPAKFTFEFDYKTFEPQGLTGGASIYSFILGILGEVDFRGQGYVKETSLAQFIEAIIYDSPSDLGSYDENSYKESVEKITYLVKNGKLPSVKGKTGSKNISKMTISEFMSLPSNSKLELFKTVTNNQYNFYPGSSGRSGADRVFIVAPTSKLAKQYDIKLDTSDNDSARYLTFVVNPFADKLDEKESMADIPISFGPSDEMADDFEKSPAGAERANRVKGIRKDWAETTTLAAFMIELLSFTKNGMKDAKGEKITSQKELYYAIKSDDSDATKKKASDAWKKEGGPADMTLGASETKGAATA